MHRYDRWGTYLPEGNFAAAVGADDFLAKLGVYGGPDAKEQWARLMARIKPLGDAIFGLPPAAVRMDTWVMLTMGRYAPALFRVLAAGGSSLELPFSRILVEERITDPFILNWLDMICFLLQGATTRDAPTTLMAYVSLTRSRAHNPSICRVLRGLLIRSECGSDAQRFLQVG